MTTDDWLTEATKRAENAAARLRHFKPSATFADNELYEIWDDLQTSAENVRELSTALGFSDPAK